MRRDRLNRRIQDRHFRCRDRTGIAELSAEYRGLPHVSCGQLNDRGGVNGSKIELIVLDDKAAPSEAAINAKRLMDDEQVLAVALMSLSSTYAPMFQAAARTKTPVLLLGQAVCPANAATPQMNPYVFCGGSTSDPNTARLLAGAAGEGAGREEQGQGEARAGRDGHSDQPAGHRHHGEDRRQAGVEVGRQAGDSACRRRCQRRRGAHHRQGARIT